MVTTTTPGGQRVTICTCTRTCHHLATFTCRPGSSLYTQTTTSPQVVASGQVFASSQVTAPCSCRLLSHQTLLWHHRLGHPSLSRLRGMHSRLLVSGLPRSLPPLPPLPAPPCLPCVEGWQRATPHSSSFPGTTAPLQTLHMDVWGPARVSGQGRECYFMLFMLPTSPQQNGVVERRIGLVMEVGRTSMIHATAPHVLWPFAVRYAAHQLNLWPHVSLPETSPILRSTGEAGDASVFRVRGSRAFVRDTSADKLSSHAIPCVFLCSPPDTPRWQIYHPTSRRVLPSQDVTFDKSVPFYCLFPYRTPPPPPPPPPPLFLAPGPPPPASAEGGGPEPANAEPGGDEPEGAEPGGAEQEGTEYGGAEPRGSASGGGPAGASPRQSRQREPLSPQQLREWFAQRTRLRSGAVGAGGPAVGGIGVGDTGVASPGCAGGTAGTGGAGAGGTGGARARDPGVGGSGAGGTAVGGTRAGDPGAGGAGAGGAGA
ncbi:unnamed protein product [Closterium sp. NIES-54]